MVRQRKRGAKGRGSVFQRKNDRHDQFYAETSKEQDQGVIKKDHLDQSLEYEPPTETIAGLTLSPETDIPFGKPFCMGLHEYIIYESAVERGYKAGIARHQDLVRDLNDGVPVMLDDTQFTAMLDAFVPKEMSSRDKALWRAHFIAGWCSVFLGLVRCATVE
jgi:hypothetical protein